MKDAENSAPCGTPIKNDGFNFLIALNKEQPAVEFTKSESLPFEVRDDIHPWKKAYWMILDHPYSAISAADGSFSIPDLPVGMHEFRVWHERVGYLDKSLKVEITDGDVTECTLSYPAVLFQPR